LNQTGDQNVSTQDRAWPVIKPWFQGKGDTWNRGDTWNADVLS
jgi:hypothetical protein